MQRIFAAMVIMAAAASLGACQSMTPEEVSTADDAQCQALGARPGSNPYVECRLFLQAQREQEADDRRRRFALALAGGLGSASDNYYRSAAIYGSAQPAPVYVPSTVHCTSRPVGPTIQTHCR